MFFIPMRKYLLIMLLLLPVVALNAQDKGREIPSAIVKNIDGESFNTEELNNDGKPMIISFWASWCKPCIKELINIHDLYEDWQDETGVKLVAMSIDDARNAAKVGPLVNGRMWDYEVYVDINQEFKRAMNVNNIPHTFLVDGAGKIVWQHNSYSEGDEYALYEQVKKLANGERIEENTTEGHQ